MYYEEKWISDVLHFRSQPDGDWHPVGITRLNQLLREAEAKLARPEATPLSRARAYLPADIRKKLEESNLPVEIATAIADLCEGKLRPEETVAKDAARYQWLKAHWDGCDFYYEASGGPDSVLIFDWPADKTVGADLDETLDRAMGNSTLPQGERPKHACDVGPCPGPLNCYGAGRCVFDAARNEDQK